jgi:hypothetical protein
MTNKWVHKLLYLLIGISVVDMLSIHVGNENVHEICSSHGKYLAPTEDNINKHVEVCECELHEGYGMHFTGAKCEINPWEECMHETDLVICQSRMNEKDGYPKEGICVDLLCSGRGECNNPSADTNNTNRICVCRVGIIVGMSDTSNDMYVQYDPSVLCKLSTVTDTDTLACNTTHGVVLRDINLNPKRCYCHITSQSPHMGISCSNPVPLSCLDYLTATDVSSVSWTVCSGTGSCTRLESQTNSVQYNCTYTDPLIISDETQCNDTARMLIHNSKVEESFFCESARYTICGLGGMAIIHTPNEYTCKCQSTRTGVRCERPSCTSLTASAKWLIPTNGRCMLAYNTDDLDHLLLYAKHLNDDGVVEWFKVIPILPEDDWIHRGECRTTNTGTGENRNDGVLGVFLLDWEIDSFTGVACVYPTDVPSTVLYNSNHSTFTLFTESNLWHMSLKWSPHEQRYEITERCVKDHYYRLDRNENLCVCNAMYMGSFCGDIVRNTNTFATIAPVSTSSPLNHNMTASPAILTGATIAPIATNSSPNHTMTASPTIITGATTIPPEYANNSLIMSGNDKRPTPIQYTPVININNIDNNDYDNVVNLIIVACLLIGCAGAHIIRCTCSCPRSGKEKKQGDQGNHVTVVTNSDNIQQSFSSSSGTTLSSEPYLQIKCDPSLNTRS